MLMHKTPQGLIREEQTWADYFFVNVDDTVVKFYPEMLTILPWHFVKYKYIPWMGQTLYVTFAFWPVLFLYDFLKQSWFFPARLAYRAGWLEVPEGAALSMNWLKYLKLWKRLKSYFS